MQLCKNLRKSVTPDGAVMFDVQRGQIFRVNLIGSTILELMSKELTVPQIAEELSRTYGLPADAIESDVREFLESLEHHQLVEMASRQCPA